MFVTRDGKVTVQVVRLSHVSRRLCPGYPARDGEYFRVSAGRNLLGYAPTVEALARLVPLEELQERLVL